jgi:hypothetical protein
VTLRDAIAGHPLAIAGALIATAAGVLFLALLIASLAGLFENPYAGLVLFVAIPAVFIAGLLLIPLGLSLLRRKQRRDPNVVVEWPVVDLRKPTVRRMAFLIVVLTAVNVVIVLLAGYGSLHWMESPSFCGQVCHTPMQPQFTAWQAGPHGRIACVACHVGEGAGAVMHAKLSGVRQLIQVASNSYPRPIPSGAEMPPGAQADTCRGCHQAEQTIGDRIRVIRAYADDEANSETATILRMHLGRASRSGRAIHWHADPAVRIEYVSTDEARQTIPLVRVTDPKGAVKDYVTADAKDRVDQLIAAGPRRTMDCIDCHNTVGHPIAPTADQAIDRAIAAGLVSRQLPYARREGLRLVQASYPDQNAATSAIANGFRGVYQSHSNAADPKVVDQTASALQDVYRHNVFPTMKVTWGTYHDNQGHVTSTGCFRCHDGEHTARDGSTVRNDCELCHTQIEQP